MREEIVKLALMEDLTHIGDLSTQYLDKKLKPIKAKIIAKDKGIMACGKLGKEIINIYQSLFKLDKSYEYKQLIADGDPFETGGILFEISAPAQSLLACERTILNFSQRLCAIATKAKELNKLIKDYPAQVLDTRKTMPGLRELEKEAFEIGAGSKHRMGLYDMVMLKENHLAAIGEDLIETINKIKENTDVKIEVEINKDNLDKLQTVIDLGVDIVMLDNFKPKEIKKIINNTDRSKVKFEASGGITESNIEDFARTGIDYISTSLASRQPNLDMSLIVEN